MLQSLKDCRVLSLALALGAFTTLTKPAAATVYITASGSISHQHMFYKQTDSVTGSGSIEIGLGQYARIGFTHEQKIEHSVGYDVTDLGGGQEAIAKVDDYSHITANSFDSTLILFNGAYLAPFLKAGLVRRLYQMENLDAAATQGTGEGKVKSRFWFPTTWELGAGLAIRLTRGFSLRYLYMLSPGYQLDIINGQQLKEVIDRNTTFGLTYEF